MTRFRFDNLLGSVGEGDTTFDALAACGGTSWANALFDRGAYTGAWDVSFPDGEAVRECGLYDGDGTHIGTFYELGL
jgi:hypothetical protein